MGVGRAKMRRTQNSGKFPPHSRKYIELTSEIRKLESAITLAKLAKGATLGDYQAMKTALEEMQLDSETEIPPNIWRHWAALEGATLLQAGKIDRFVTAIFPVALNSHDYNDLSQKSDGDDAIAMPAIDLHDPRISAVAIAKKEEDSLANAEGDDLDFIDKAKREELSKWGDFLRDAFACEPLFRILASNKQEGLEVAIAWLNAMKSVDMTSESLAASTADALNDISLFCKAPHAFSHRHLPFR